jgi:hypothetical protein
MQIFYGTSECKMDVTDICYTKLLHDDIISIPRGDLTRVSIFSDPVYGVVKKIFIQLQDILEYDDTFQIEINTIHKTINTKTERFHNAIATIIDYSKSNSDIVLNECIQSLQDKIKSMEPSSKKILNIMACHVDSSYKYETILNNINFLCGDLIIINTQNLPYNKLLELRCKQYIEIENNSELDIGKMMHVLQNVDYSDYDFIVLMNDSVYFVDTLQSWYNCMAKEDKDLYGYSSNVEHKYHYHSFLYGVKKTGVQILIDFYKDQKEKFQPYDKVYSHIIQNFEILFANEFSNKACYIDIVEFPSQYHSNLFFYCDELYGKLLEAKIMTLVKLKRVLWFF